MWQCLDLTPPESSDLENYTENIWRDRLLVSNLTVCFLFDEILYIYDRQNLYIYDIQQLYSRDFYDFWLANIIKSVTSRPIQSPENTQALHSSNIRAALALWVELRLLSVDLFT